MQEEVGLMAYIGGFLGGGVEMVPAGQGQLCLQWLTPDRQNMEGAVFTVTGIGSTVGTYTKEADDTGRAEMIVAVGDYEATVKHEGNYSNDGPQRIHVESAQAYLVIFSGEHIRLNKYVQLHEPSDAAPGDIWLRESA